MHTYRIALLASFCVLGGASPAAAQSRARTAQPYALQGVLLSSDGDSPKTLILRNGAIESILDADAEIPPGVQRVDGEGLIALPAFIDAYTHTGCETPEPVIDMDRPADTVANARIDMREANRKGIQPGFSAVDVLSFGDEGPNAHREAGFGLLASSPSGEILSGRSVLATTNDAAVRDVVVRSVVFQHAAFAASGSGYPGTLMGYHAQLRQLFLDAGRHELLKQRVAAGRLGMRPSYYRDLDAGAELLGGRERLVCEAESVRDIRRWMRLAEEFELEIAISGGRGAWECAEELAERGIPVLLTLEWGDEVDDPDDDTDKDVGKGKGRKRGKGVDADPDDVDDPEDNAEDDAEDDAGEDTEDAEGAEGDKDKAWTYTEPLGVRRERRRLWEEGRDCAVRLHEAGVTFAFATGAEAPKDLLKKVRTLVKNGLAAEVAMAALTTVPSKLLGVDSGYGRLAPGARAAVALWNKDPFEKKAKVAWLFVDGFAYDLEVDPEDEESGGDGPADGVDLTGDWAATDGFPGSTGSTLALTMDADGALSGTIEFELGGTPMKQDVEGHVDGKSVSMRISFSVGEVEITSRIEGDFDGDRVEGDMTIGTPAGDQTVEFEMQRTPGRSEKGNL